MAILSKRMMTDVSRRYYREFGLRPLFLDLTGRPLNRTDPLASLPNTRRRRDYALQQSLNTGEANVFTPFTGGATWITCLEDRRRIHGGLEGGVVLRAEAGDSREEMLHYLVDHGMEHGHAMAYLRTLRAWPEERIVESARFLTETFYQVSGWIPEKMKENQLKALRQQQISQAIEDGRRQGNRPLYAFEKERVLLACIRAGDRNGARRILNDMLAAIFMSSSQLAVLRARAVELMSYLTRAAIEDNPLMEPLIQRNHTWTERLVKAANLEDLSHDLMQALDDFMDGIYLHGANRSNTKVRRALDYIGAHFAHKIGLNQVAKDVGISPGRLAHLIKDYTGRTVSQTIQEVRVRQAQQLLQRTSKSGAEIAFEVGFGDQSYFIKHFKRLTGTTPARYRRSR